MDRVASSTRRGLPRVDRVVAPPLGGNLHVALCMHGPFRLETVRAPRKSLASHQHDRPYQTRQGHHQDRNHRSPNQVPSRRSRPSHPKVHTPAYHSPYKERPPLPTTPYTPQVHSTHSSVPPRRYQAASHTCPTRSYSYQEYTTKVCIPH